METTRVAETGQAIRNAALLLILATLPVGAALADSPQPSAAAGALRPLLLPDRIRADTVVILAHPDDEGVVAPLLARWALVDRQRVVNIYMTAGELGTDKVGAVQGPAFGYMRLTELHRTLDRLGVAMFHDLGLPDVSPHEGPSTVLAKWDRTVTVRLLARYLRLLRPDRLLAFVPGPASGHVAHMASGGAALLAARAAADPTAFPEQIATEGLRPWTIPQVLLFAQAEKLAYDPYPVDAVSSLPGSVTVEEIPVTVYDPDLRRTYADLAREALKEQRSVGASAGQARGGPFDAPVRLIHAFDGPEAPAVPRTLSLTLEATSPQRFFEEIAREVGAARLLDAFRPEASIPSGVAEPSLTVHVRNDGTSRVEGALILSLPEGWTARPEAIPLSLGAGEERGAAWAIVAAPSWTGAAAPAEIVARTGGRQAQAIAGLRFAIKRP
jgi:LmbE family N-acetylglucosaminyl deacetylase